jgi:hypothetical protein
MAKSIQIPRSRLSAVDRLIRFDLKVPNGAMSELLKTIEYAEQTGESLELLDAEGRMPMGRVTVFARTVRPLGNTGLDEWVIRLRAEDKKAEDTLAALPFGPPDPY